MKNFELKVGYLVKDVAGDYSLVIRHQGKLYGICFPSNDEDGVVLDIDSERMTIDNEDIVKVYGWSEAVSVDAEFSICTISRPVLWERKAKKEITFDSDWEDLETKADKLKWIELAREKVKEESKTNPTMLLASVLLNPLLDVCENEVEKEYKED